MRLDLIRLACILLLALSGCGGRGETVPVAGEVTLDGTPLPTGVITFTPAAGGAGTAAEITDGKYTTRVPPGAMTVSVISNQVANTDGQTATEQIVPVEYNTETTLTADIPPGGDPALNFPLTTTP